MKNIEDSKVGKGVFKKIAKIFGVIIGASIGFVTGSVMIAVLALFLMTVGHNSFSSLAYLVSQCIAPELIVIASLLITTAAGGILGYRFVK